MAEKKKKSALSWMSGRLPEPEYLPTPSFGINRALGGKGLQSGRVHVYWGLKASGKTTAALHQVALAQAEGKVCGYVDAEKAFTPEWAEKIGVDVDALKIVQKQAVEPVMELVGPDLQEGKIDLLVVDSLSSLNFEGYFDNNNNSMGIYARSAKWFVHQLLYNLNHNQQIILIAHAAMDLSGTYPVLSPAMGNAIDHWASTTIKFQIMKGKDAVRESDGAKLVKWQITKSKQSQYPVSGQYWFNDTTATVDNVDELVSAALDEELIQQAGAWFYYPYKDAEDVKMWQGKNAVTQALKDDEAFFDELSQKLIDKGVEAEEEDGEA